MVCDFDQATMRYDTDFLVRLIGASDLLGQGRDLEQSLRELAAMTASLLGTQRCSIMLLGHAQGDEAPSLRVYAHYGDLPKDAYRQATGLNQGIAGRVVASGEALLIRNIAESPFAQQARRSITGGNRSLISAPIPLDGKPVGVINVDSPIDGRVLGEEDLRLVNLFALYVGKSLHVVQLQNALNSRLLQYALAREAMEAGRPRDGRPVSPDPERLIKLVAKSVYRELRTGGFSPAQIIGVASAVMDELREAIAKRGRGKNGIGA
jgi:L-methionine (R)-S-oxide reductase